MLIEEVFYFFVTVGHACSDFFKHNDYQSKDMNIQVVEKWQNFSISISNGIMLQIHLIPDALFSRLFAM